LFFLCSNVDMSGTISDTVGAEAQIRALRRQARLDTLAIAREAMGRSIEQLSDGAAVRLPVCEQEAFDRRPGDPYLAMSRLSRELCRIVLLEERLDEDAETREKRLAEERAERDRKVLAQESALTRNAKAAALDDKIRTVREAVGRIYLSAYPKTPQMEVHRLLDGLLNDYEYDFDEDLDEAYDGDAAVIVARICEEAEIEAPPEGGAKDDTPEAARARLIRLAQTYIEMMSGAGAANANRTAEPVAALAQGPPG
jgi:hypothetical protein